MPFEVGAVASLAKFRIDVAMHDLLMHTNKPGPIWLRTGFKAARGASRTGAIMAMTTFRVPQFYRKILLLALVAGTLPSTQLDSQEKSVLEQQSDATLQPARAGATAERIFAELIRRNDLRKTKLRSYSEMRSYSVSDQKGKCMHKRKFGWIIAHPTQNLLSRSRKRDRLSCAISFSTA